MKIFGSHDEKTIAQMEGVAENAAYTALMADGHFGYVMPIGGVAAYRNKVSLNGVGVDIACGNAAIRTNLKGHQFDKHMWGVVADCIVDQIAFGPGGKNKADDAPRNHVLFDDPAWGVIPRKQQGNFIDKCRAQLGTTGGGNHYVDVFTDENDDVWVGVHFGSRAMGFTFAHNFVAWAQGGEWGDRPSMDEEVLLSLDTPLGKDYWAVMQLAGEYAYAGREWVARKVVDIMGGLELEMVHNHHNFAWKEFHHSEELIVVRKGATPADPGQKGFVGGSMGDDSVILRGSVGVYRHPGQIESLYSTVHGAGRVMGRMAAKGKWKRGECIRPGRISQVAMNKWMADKDVVLRGGDLDEAPQAYRRLTDVLEAQGDTIEVLHTLTPRVVCMAPKDGKRGR